MAPLSFGMDSAPPLPSLSLHDVRWKRTLLRGSPLGLSGDLGYPLSQHALCWERTLLRGCPLLLGLLDWGVPFLLL